MVKHPIDFMSGLFSAVGKGFTQFGDNIQSHLVKAAFSNPALARTGVWYIEKVKKVFESAVRIVDGNFDAAANATKKKI